MGIQIVGHTSFLGSTGYNAHSQAFFTTLNKHIPVRIRNYTYVPKFSDFEKKHLHLLIEQYWQDPPHKIGTPFKPNPQDQIVNIVLNESNQHFFYDDYDSPLIFYNVWESTRQMPEYFNRMLEADQFWCPTQWQRQCTIDQGYPADRVKVVPEGVDGTLFKPSNNPKTLRKYLYKKYNIPEDALTFMIFGRWDYRKAVTEMVRSFVEEFKNDDNIYLAISVDNPFSVDGMNSTEERLKFHGLEHERIRILHFPERQEYIHWLQSGNIFLSCSRSEGWNLPLMEALACGAPSICSKWGGQEYAYPYANLVNVPKELPPQNVFMVSSKDSDGIGVWGEPDFDHLKHVMRQTVNDYNQQTDKFSKASKIIRETYTWENAVLKAEKYISDLAKKIKHMPKKHFKVRFETTDEGFPKLLFKPDRDYKKIKVVMSNSLGETLYDNEFNNIEKGLEYWMVTSFPEETLDSLVVDFVQNDCNIQTEVKDFVKQEPVISFVTSFYNAERFIDELAESVFEQTYKNWEWIVTDDWSNDNTKEKVLDLCSRDSRVKYIEQEFKQEIYWNPHKYANGKYILTIDADDQLVPKTGEVICKYFDDNPEVSCIHTSGNYYLNEFTSGEFKNSSFCKFDGFDNILEKHKVYLENKSGYERVGYMFGCIRAYRNPGSAFDFNDGDYQLGKHEDLVKLLRMEEQGKTLYLNRTLYKVRMREDSNSGNWENQGRYEAIEFDKMYKMAERRREKVFECDKRYEPVRKRLYPFLYSNLNNETERKKVLCIAFGLSKDEEDLIREVYFDHDLVFDEIYKYPDYIFVYVKSIEDIKQWYDEIINVSNCEVTMFMSNDNWDKEFYNVENSSNYFPLFNEVRKFLEDKTPFIFSTYLYKYCFVQFNTPKNEQVKLNLGCDIKNMELYQDQYINGKTVIKGKRDCESRYAVMKSIFEKYNRPFTILDIGANFGYYSIRASTEYNAISVMVESNENEVKTLKSLCEHNDCRDKLTIINTRLNLYKLKELVKCEHFDVVFALNVLHHFNNNEVLEACEALTKLGDNIILETPPPDDSGSCGQNNLQIIVDYFNHIEKTKLGEFKRHTSNKYSEIFWIRSARTDLKWPYYNYEKIFTNKGADVVALKSREPNFINSTFNRKTIHSPKRDSIKEWIPGINLKTFVELNGIYPNADDIISKLKNKDIITDYKWDGTDNDLTVHNFILSGCLLHLIDFDDKTVKRRNTGDEDQLQKVIDYIYRYFSPVIQKPKFNVHFVDGPFAEVVGDPRDKGIYKVEFIDLSIYSIVHKVEMKINTWTRPNRKWFTNWLIRIERSGKVVYQHKFNCEGKNILVSFDSKSLGDSIAWMAKAEEFRKTYKCNVYLSTFWNKLFIEAYPEINFINPGSAVDNIYASFTIGCWEGNLDKNKADWRTVSLQNVCGDILGLEHSEIVTELGIQPGPRPIKEKYVAFAEFSTFYCKFWNYPGGWQIIVDYLNKLGYKVMSISKEKTKLKNVIKMNDKSIEETITNIAHCEFFIGVSSGPSWIAWTLNRPVIMISGFSAPYGEFETKCERIINKDVCNSCFNDTLLDFDRGSWLWCPRMGGTERAFECTKKIVPEMVKQALHKIRNKNSRQKEIVFITGTGRSGTSLCSNILNSSGYLIPSDDINEFYEITEVKNLNDSKISKNDIRNFLQNSFEKFGNKLSIKDPRFSRNKTIIPWSEVAGEFEARVKWIFCFRHPDATLKSMIEQGVRKGIDELWWKTSVEFALFHKDKFLFLDYDLSDSDINILCIQQFLNLETIPDNKYDKKLQTFETDKESIKKFKTTDLGELYLKMKNEQRKFIERECESEK